MRIAIREDMIPGSFLPEQLAWVESMGIDGIELHAGSLQMPRDELHTALAQSPVDVSAIEGIPQLVDPDRPLRDEAVRKMHERIRLAGELGATGVLVVPQFGRAPALPDLTPWRTGADLERELLLAQLRELAPVAVEAGVILFIEPLNRFSAHLVNRIEQGAAIAREAGPGIATMADLFHMNIEEADIAVSIRQSADHIVYVHLADSNRLQPGKGHVDFRSAFAALKAIGYDGWLGLECSVSGNYDTAMRATISFIHREWEAV